MYLNSFHDSLPDFRSEIPVLPRGAYCKSVDHSRLLEARSPLKRISQFPTVPGMLSSRMIDF